MFALTTVTDDYLAEPSVSEELTSIDLFFMMSPMGQLTVAALLIGMVVLCAWALGKVIRKAGVDEWKAWVPVYNIAVIFTMGRFSPWLALLSVLGPVFILFCFVAPSATLLLVGGMMTILFNLVVGVLMIISAHRINRSFGRGIGSTVLYFFLPHVWVMILAFGPERWNAEPVDNI